MEHKSAGNKAWRSPKEGRQEKTSPKISRDCCGRAFGTYPAGTAAAGIGRAIFICWNWPTADSKRLFRSVTCFVASSNTAVCLSIKGLGKRTEEPSQQSVSEGEIKHHCAPVYARACK